MRVAGYEAAHQPVRPENVVRESGDIAQKTPVRGRQSVEGAATDTVAWSSGAREAERIYEVIQQTPEVRHERIAEAQQALADGMLVLQGQVLADKVIFDPLNSVWPQSSGR